MTYACPITDIFTAWTCLDFWLSRYQGLLVGGCALLLAAMQVWIALQNMSIQKEQQRSRAMSEATQKSISTLAIDRLLRSAARLNELIISRALHVDVSQPGQQIQFSWRPIILLNGEALAFRVDHGDIEKDAATAFPTRATDLVELDLASKAAEEAIAAIRGLSGMNVEELEFGTLTDEQTSVMGAVNTAFNQLFAAVHRCSDLMPDNRLQATD